MNHLGSDVGISMVENQEAVRRRGLEPPRSLPPLEPESIVNSEFFSKTRHEYSQKTSHNSREVHQIRDSRSLIENEPTTGSRDNIQPGICSALLSALETWLSNPTGPGESLTRAALESYFADPATLTGGAS